MLVSTANLTLGCIEGLYNRGYDVEVLADEEYANVNKRTSDEEA